MLLSTVKIHKNLLRSQNLARMGVQLLNEAQKRANAKYKKKTYYNVGFQLNKATNQDLIEWLEAQPNKTGYLKELIRADMMKKGK